FTSAQRAYSVRRRSVMVRCSCLAMLCRSIGAAASGSSATTCARCRATPSSTGSGHSVGVGRGRGRGGSRRHLRAFALAAFVRGEPAEHAVGDGALEGEGEAVGAHLAGVADGPWRVPVG